MSKAEELAEKLDLHGRPGGLCGNAAAHLRALEANRQMLVEACTAMSNYIDKLGGDSKKYRTALEQAKELT